MWLLQILIYKLTPIQIPSLDFNEVKEARANFNMSLPGCFRIPVDGCFIILFHALTGLWVCYSKGRGVEQDWDKAIMWYTKAAVQGYMSAQLNLGYCYYNGQGVEIDMQMAAIWWEKAGEQGNAEWKGYWIYQVFSPC